MSVSLDDVLHVAALARLALSPERAQAVVTELNTILGHMEVLSRVDTTDVGDAATEPPTPLPLRADAGPPIPLDSGPPAFGPAVRDGFFLVPRLETHEDAEATS